MHKRTLDNLSDVELHKKLMEYGLHSGPVTETTRPLLLKKLKTHIQSSKRQTSIGGTSSPYSSDSGTSRPYQSLAAKELQSSNYNLPLIDQQSRSSMPSIIPAREITRRNTKSTTTTANTFDKNYASVAQRTYPNNSAINVTNTSNNKIYKRYAASSSDSEDDSKYAGNASANMMHRQPPPPHFNVVGRLLNLRDSTLQYKKSPLTAHESLEYAHKRGIYSQMKPAYAMYNNHGQVHQSLWQRLKAFSRSWRGFKASHIPHAIIFVFVVFLIVIASVYLIKHPDLASLIRESNTHYVLCNSQAQSKAVSTESFSIANKPLFNCLEEKNFAKALAYNRELIQLLHAQAIQHYCVNNSSPHYLSTNEFIKYLIGQENTKTITNNDNMNSWKMRELLDNFQSSVYLIKHNPQWNVAILNNNGVVMEPTQLKVYVADGDTRFALLKPNLPLSCVIYNKLQRFFFIMGIFVLILTLCSVAYAIFRHIQKLKHERQTAVSNFCTEIINAVVYQASLNDGSGGNAVEKEIIINHIRDKLIPLNKRKEYLGYWNEALKLLEANESRVQFGITMRSGEEYRCVRWVANVASDNRDLNYRKQWQSPAFDNANKICNPPTPCLKIRYMFDNSEVQMPNLRKVIEEAIFEKVGSRCNILDIQLDLQSCCVYLRCASEEDAGIAHNEINGWWFDKRLISIKFVRLQRYLSRFPESKS